MIGEPRQGSSKPKVLVIGGGGREHALIKALLRSRQHPRVICAPGNAGIAGDVACFAVSIEDLDGLCALALDQDVSLVVVGPEAPLVAGVADLMGAKGVAVFGPSKAAAQLEGSKAFAKQVMSEAGIPTADYRVVDSLAAGQTVLEEFSYPIVLKADGLAAGKGVIIASDRRAAEAALTTFFVEQRFGKAADSVLIEQFLEGQELSLLALCDGENVVAMAPAKDYKRIFDGDAGPNTGGMGSYSPVPGIAADEIAEIIATVHQPVVDLMRKRGTPYSGVLYAGLMLSSAGPKVLEFNCRFGDPETQVVLPRLNSDLLAALQKSSVQGGLAGYGMEWSKQSAVDVVLASRGYPQGSSKGDPIEGLDAAAQVQAVELIHAGTALQGDSIVTNGGRVLGITALGDNVTLARARAYQAVECVRFSGMQFRKDIAERAIDRADNK